MKIFMSISLLLSVASLSSSCSKQAVEGVTTPASKTAGVELRARKGGGGSSGTFVRYTIQAGNHQCDQSTIKTVRTGEMRFVARFNETAIYTSVSPENQYDINKLYGFSEGFDNQYNSARFGWNWVDGSIRLHASVYAKGVRQYALLGSYALNTEIPCSIRVSGANYIFTAGNISLSMPRGASTKQASGYQQYPYFGGDEVAPHLIEIDIKTL